MLSKLLFVAAGAEAFIMKGGDPVCRNGFRSIPADPNAITVCCPKYCGRCNDYETCSKVNEQDSANACCASKVQSLVCENNAADPYCLKKCDVKSAPCSLGVVAKFEAPKLTSAAADCGEAADTYHDTSKSTVDSASSAGADATAPSQWPAVAAQAAQITAASTKPAPKAAPSTAAVSTTVQGGKPVAAAPAPTTKAAPTKKNKRRSKGSKKGL